MGLFIGVLSGRSSVRELQLVGVGLADGDASALGVAVATGLPALTALDVSSNELTDCGASSLVRALTRRGAGTSSLVPIEQLDVSHNFLGDGATTRALCTLLQQDATGPFVRRLGCTSVGLTVASHSLLVEAALRAHSLVSLALDSNPLGVVGVYDYCRSLVPRGPEAMASRSMANLSLSHLSDDEFGMLATPNSARWDGPARESLGNLGIVLGQLRSLRLAGVGLTNACLGPLGSAVRVMSELQILDVSCNMLSWGDTASGSSFEHDLVGSCGHGLRSLNVSGNRLSAEHVSAMIAMLPHCAVEYSGLASERAG